jgi:hypothetical protein
MERVNHPPIFFFKFEGSFIFGTLVIYYNHPVQVIHPFLFNIFKRTLFVKHYLYDILCNIINML